MQKECDDASFQFCQANPYQNHTVATTIVATVTPPMRIAPRQNVRHKLHLPFYPFLTLCTAHRHNALNQLDSILFHFSSTIFCYGSLNKKNINKNQQRIRSYGVLWLRFKTNIGIYFG